MGFRSIPLLCLLLALALASCNDDPSSSAVRANRIPLIESATVLHAYEDSVFTFSPRFTDSDGPDTVITYTVIPSWLSVVDDTVSGTPGEHTPDTVLAVAVSDGMDTVGLRLILRVHHTNDPPTVVAADTLFATSGFGLHWTADVNDPDDTALAYEWLHLPHWCSHVRDSAYGVPEDTSIDDSIVLSVADAQSADTAVTYIRVLPPLVVYGDTRTGHDAHQRVVDRIREHHPATVFHVGDLVYNGDNISDWTRFNTITADLRSESEFFPALGNHEHQSQLYFDNFDLPGNEEWYSVERNRVHFIVLNTCVPFGPASAQYHWFLDDLASVSDSTWLTAVVLHHPPYSTGPHVDDEVGVRDTLVPIFEQYGVDVVFAGHDHDYERSFCGGIYYLVTGGGGAPLRDQVRQHPCSQLFLKKHHFCKLSILPDTMHVRVIDDSGVQVDSFTVLASP